MNIKLLRHFVMTHRPKFVASIALSILVASGGAHAAENTANDGDKLVAIVNGINIQQFEYDLAEQSLQAELENLSNSQRQQRVLQFLIDFKLMGEAARRADLHKSLEFTRKIAYLSEQTLNNQYFINNVLAQIDDAALRSFYDQEMNKIVPSSETHIRHILFDDEDNGKLVLGLLEGGGDFIQLAEEYSIGPSKTQGGDLGYFPDGEMEPEFLEVIKLLKVGEYTPDLVKTKFGYHIIRLEDIRQKPLPTFEKVKNSLYGILVQEKADQLSADLRKDAQIELFVAPEATPSK